ncbi:MerR family transcriptional regulator [Knoellia sp. p5-6-4]|uniref:transcriptional regulator FtsR n=1 Tax=unclassified Knoellia TaxID=2618719 RepID=UPI0023DBAD66|nr:MerR family transcriptional regulator [Knoellia sp. p5-6-4]MDF2146938.1 MerR family transcriptional regulator [Knoellia sp. p5-6-4]
MTIGAVLDALKPDFPDISISKIRFLEAEGLITPERTPSGYRHFSDEDVERLRYILTAQRDRFWPLKVIRESLDALDRGLTPPGDSEGERPQPPRPAPDPDVPTAAELTRPGTLRLTREELAASAGLDAPTLEALDTFGLLRPDGGGHYGEAALAIAHAAAGLAAYGIEPRHLRPFRTAADREIGLVQQVAAPLRGRGGRAGKDDPTGDILRLCIALHTALVKDGLGQA